MNDDAEIMTATDASRAFSDLLHRVSYGGESFIIKKGNRLMARITPVEAPVEKTAEIVSEETAPAAPAHVVSAIETLIQAASLPTEPAPGEEDEYYKAVLEQMQTRAGVMEDA